jgi:hypothetical protein
MLTGSALQACPKGTNPKLADMLKLTPSVFQSLTQIKCRSAAVAYVFGGSGLSGNPQSCVGGRD